MLKLPFFNDMHVHLRDYPLAANYLRAHKQYCDHVMAMPNTKGEGLCTVQHVEDYLAKMPEYLGIFAAIKLNSQTTPEIVQAAAKHPRILAAKLYPDGVTTNSDSGIKNTRDLYPVFAAMEEAGLVLSVHGESPGVFCLRRETEFVMNDLSDIHFNFPKLRIVLEHITTHVSVQFVKANAHDGVAATITPHHLLLTLDDVVGDKLQPLNFCKPIAKEPSDRSSLLAAATSGLPCFFLGSDSAPHPSFSKYSDCSCAGCYTAPIVPSLLAQAFEEHGALDKLPDFASNFGADFYRFERSVGDFTLYRRKRRVVTREMLAKGGAILDPSATPIFVPPGGFLTWSLEDTDSDFAALLNVNGQPYQHRYLSGQAG